MSVGETLVVLVEPFEGIVVEADRQRNVAAVETRHEVTGFGGTGQNDPGTRREPRHVGDLEVAEWHRRHEFPSMTQSCVACPRHCVSVLYS